MGTEEGERCLPCELNVGAGLALNICALGIPEEAGNCKDLSAALLAGEVTAEEVLEKLGPELAKDPRTSEDWAKLQAAMDEGAGP